MRAVSLFRPYSSQRWLWVALLAAFLVVGGMYTHKAMKNRSAFLRWREQVLALDGESDIYQRFQYPNPPIMALILRPLAQIEPPLVGALLWFALKAAMAALALAMVFRLVEHGGPAFPSWAKGLAILLSLRPLTGDLTHGNVNILILFLVITSLFAFHRGRDYLAGLLLALAICCKVTPLLFVPYFVWKRQWRLLAGTAAGIGLFLFAMPSLFLGWQENQHRLTSWANQMVVPFMRDGLVSSEHPNQSLPGVVNRLLTRSPSFSDYPDNIYTPTEYHNVADIGRDGARRTVRIAQGLFALLVVLVCRTPARDRGGWRLSCEFAIILIGMLIFSERTWKHHAVTLALPFATLAYGLAVLSMSQWKRVAAGASLAVAMGLMLSASGLLSTRAADLAQVYGVYLWAFIVLLATLVMVLAGRRPEFTAPSVQ